MRSNDLLFYLLGLYSHLPFGGSFGVIPTPRNHVVYQSHHSVVKSSNRRTMRMNFIDDFISGWMSFYDDRKESNRKFRRTIYGEMDWRRHRSSGRHFNELRRMPVSQILKGVFPQSFAVALFSTFIYIYNRFLEIHPKVALYLPMLAFPGLPFNLMSPSLGLLLVFRTNTAYSRWKDSRIAWAVISAKSFTLMRHGLAYFTDKSLQLSLFKYAIAFSTAAKWHLTNRANIDELKEDLGDLLSLSELEDFLKAKNKPLKAILEITSIIKKADLIASIQSHMDKSLGELIDAFYVCDRIYTTPIPLFYTRHTARFLLLWLLTTPMALYNEIKICKFAMVPISVLNALFLFGIEELGVQIEEPFSILPLGNICNEIKSTAEDLMKASGLKWADTFTDAFNPTAVAPSVPISQSAPAIMQSGSLDLIGIVGLGDLK